MIIKSINNVEGYKSIEDGFMAEFDDNKTYIVGENFQGKTTIGSLFSWCLTGCGLCGKEKEQVSDDKRKISNVIVDMTFIDNQGIEHRIVRNKGKELHITLDGQEVKQENLGQFYKDKDIFLVANNPSYFWTLEPKQQRDLIRRILPTVDKEKVFEVLDKSEQEIIKEPIENLSSYTDIKTERLRALENEYNQNIGTIRTLQSIALEKEGTLIEFEKEKELQELQEKLDNISIGLQNENLEDIQKQINGIDRRLTEIITVDLVKIIKEYNIQKEKIESVDKENPICPECMQEIKNSEKKENMKKFYKNRMAKLQRKADELKETAKKLTEEKQEKQLVYNKLNTSSMQEIQNERNQIKEKIDILTKEKQEITLHNKEVQTILDRVQKAKEQLENYNKKQEEIKEELELTKNQKKIANKLKIFTIESQKEKIKQYLSKVNIEFSKVNKSTGEITECLNIQYEGRDFKKLSKSQQSRASLEISNVFNNISEINAPIFFDDSESTTEVQDIPNTQLIIATVIKYNKLEILYNYENVLERKAKSIQREIEENSYYNESLVA